MFSVDIDSHGPILDGRGGMVVRDFCDDWERSFARDIEEQIQVRLASVLKHPTGRYQSSIGIRASGMGQEVHDSGIIYGPWLEGTGSRNAPKTRFKGYSTFRRTHQGMDARAAMDANAMFRTGYLRRLT